MKSLLATILAVSLCWGVARAEPVTIGGIAVGKTFQGPVGPDASFGTAFMGMRVLKVSDHANVFGAVQGAQIETPRVNAWGGDVILQADFKEYPDFSLLMDLGWLTKVALDGNGARTSGLAIGAGAAWQTTDILGLFVYVKGYDAGSQWDYTGYVGMFGLNLHTLVPGLR